MTFRQAQWRVLLAASLCYLFYYTGRQNFGWAIKGIREDLGLSNTQIGWISGTGLVCYGVGQIVSGQLGDRLGGRRLVTLGAILSCLFNWLTSFGRGFWPLLVLWSLNNSAQSMGFAPASRLITNWWGYGERGKAFGIFNFAAGAASVLVFAAAIVVLGSLSWVWVFRLPVLLLPIAALAFFGLVRDRPEELGFRSPSDRPGAAVEPVADGPQETAGGRFRAVLGNRRFVIASVGFGFTNWARLGLLVWVPVHFLGEGWRQDPTGAWITLSLPVGMALGALAAGYGADRFLRADHPRLIVLFLGLASATLLVTFLVSRDQRGLGVALLFLAGFFVFGPVASFSALCAEILGRRSMGTGIGFMNAVGYGTAALGDLVIGIVLDATGRTASLFLITTGACLVAAGCGLVIRVRPVRPVPPPASTR